MKQYYECHITIDPYTKIHVGRIDEIKKIVLRHKWKFNAINGDPELGNGLKCYATMHYSIRNTKEVILNKLLITRDKFLNEGLTIIRAKIEMVVYDSRTA